MIFRRCRPLFHTLRKSQHYVPPTQHPRFRPPQATTSAAFVHPFRDFWGMWRSGWMSDIQTRMAIDLVDHGDAYIIEAELPGVKRDRLDVRVGDHGRSLLIEAKLESRPWDETDHASQEKERTNEWQILSERTSHFVRKVWLPHQVDAARINASLEDGVLKLHIPKTKEDGSVRVDVV
ncbi:hypothetical protein PIIN_06676 [Serendipita indica DSM 11827]|uniref:SHSP domain-containing protein n=1 Tax=Serendipita indica (strain DSM 11827) TaxID=1109443 RepID=G4TN47_SERID|nr:hypothetical protein PIIN_06676 [Serendipita indica DSM 11827]